MQYHSISKAIFLERPNRFIAHIELDGAVQICHVKNTGRCRELLVPGCTVYVQRAPEGAVRKTLYDLIAVQKGDRLINMDSQIPNRVFEEWAWSSGFFGPLTLLRREVPFGNSRLDCYLEAGPRRIFVEIKGVTLEENGIVRFPDAPTQRGVKHLEELCRCVREGFEAWAVFIVQMEQVHYFTPNRATHPQFGDALAAAQKAGVNLLALDCLVTPGSITANRPVPIRLEE